MKQRTKIILAVTAGALVGGYWFLVRQASEPAAGSCAWRLDLPRVRALAASIPGDKPREVREERLATFHMPGAVMLTGESWAMTEMPVYAYQLVFPDRTILVDTAMSAEQTKEMHGADFDEAAWGRLRKAMDTASAIYVTHEHADHLGGLLADAEKLAGLDRIHLTREQLDHPDRLKPVVMPPSVGAQLKPLVYEGALAVAPGVVLIKAAGHTPGSQLVFVQLADGRELLFTGDTAWHMQNIDEVRIPPRLTSLVLHNDREANSCQLAALHQLATTAPTVNVVPGHDGPLMAKLLASGSIQAGFK